MRIRKITTHKYTESIPVYCLSAHPDHEIVVVGDKGEYVTGNCNFSLLFGTSAFSFAVRSLKGKDGWTIEQCEQFIKENSTPKYDLNIKREKLISLMAQKGAIGSDLPEEEREKLSYYWVCAIVIKERFFTKYNRMQQWMQEQIDWATSYGYVTSVFGAVRRLPQLTKDSFVPQNIKKNLHNISINSPVQTYEAVLILSSMVEIQRQLQQRNMKSKIVGTVHDSCVMYIHPEEVEMVYTLIRQAFEMDRKENKGIPMIAELDVADYDEGQAWGFGTAYKPPKKDIA